MVSLEIHKLTGIRHVDILATIVRLANGEDLDGHPKSDFPEVYPDILKRCPDIREAYTAEAGLNHVAERLSELDKDGRAAHLWRKLCQKWPVFAKFVHDVGRSEREKVSESRSRSDQTPPKGPVEIDQQQAIGHSDGPEGGRWVWWKNKRHAVPKGVVYRLLGHMWDRDSASYDDLRTFKVIESDVAPQTIRSYANKVNNALPAGFPWRLSSDSISRQLTKVSADMHTTVIPKESLNGCATVNSAGIRTQENTLQSDRYQHFEGETRGQLATRCLPRFDQANSRPRYRPFLVSRVDSPVNTAAFIAAHGHSQSSLP